MRKFVWLMTFEGHFPAFSSFAETDEMAVQVGLGEAGNFSIKGQVEMRDGHELMNL